MPLRNLAAGLTALFIAAGPFLSAQQPAPAKALDELAWLVGGRWIAEVNQPSGDALTVETTFEWSGNKKALRYAVVFKTKKGGTVPQYDGMYWWNPAKKSLTMLQVDRGGNMTEAVVTVEKGKWKQQNVLTKLDGTKHEQRAEFAKLSDDSFTFKAFVQKGDEWVEAVAFTYKRARDAEAKSK